MTAEKRTNIGILPVIAATVLVIVASLWFNRSTISDIAKLTAPKAKNSESMDLTATPTPTPTTPQPKTDAARTAETTVVTGVRINREEPPIPKRVQAVIRQCLNQNKVELPKPIDAMETLETLLRAFETFGSPEVEVMSQVFHSRTTDDRDVRLLVERGETAGRTLRYFTVDDEGLPIPQPLPASLTNLTPDQTVATFLKGGELRFAQSKRIIRWNSSTSANLTVTNGRISDLLFHFPQGALGCVQTPKDELAANADTDISCRCL